MDETLSTFSILSGLIKGFSYYTLAQIFPEFHSWDWFSLEGKTIFEGDKGGKVGRKKSPMQLFFVSSYRLYHGFGRHLDE